MQIDSPRCSECFSAEMTVATLTSKPLNTYEEASRTSIDLLEQIMSCFGNKP